MKTIKFIIFALFVITSLTFKEREVYVRHSIKKIKPIKHYKNPPPWKVYSKKEIINKEFKRC